MNEQKDPRRIRFTNYGVAMVNRSIESIDKLKRFTEKSNYIIKEEELSLILTTLRSKIDELEEYYFKKSDKSIVFTLDPKFSSFNSESNEENRGSKPNLNKGYFEEIQRLEFRIQNLEKDHENTKIKVTELTQILKQK